MARIALLLVLILAGVPWMCAQSPPSSVPDGEPTPTATLTGVVHGPNGEALADIIVSVKRVRPGWEDGRRTNGQGEFSLSPPPGRYTVTAAAPGFVSASQEVSIEANRPAKVDLHLSPQPAAPAGNKSPPDCLNVEPNAVKKPGEVSIAPCRVGAASVPDGDAHASVAAVGHSAPRAGSAPGPSSPGDVPIPASGAVAVSGTFAKEVDLAAWLNGQSARNLRVQAIVSPAQGNQNLFIWIAHTGVDQHFVIAANQVSTSDDLQNILKAYPQAAVIGLVWVQHDRYLVLRSNP